MGRFVALQTSQKIRDTYENINDGFTNIEAEVDDTNDRITEVIDDANERILEHIDGVAERHGTDDIDNDSLQSGTTLTDAINANKAQIESAVLVASNAEIGVFSINAVGTNTITGTYTDLTLFAGLKINLKIANDNTGTATFNLNSLGAKIIYKIGKDGAKVALAPRDIIKNSIAQLEYDGTDFILINPADDIGINTEIGVAWNQGDDDVYRVSRSKDYTRASFDTLAPWVNIKRCVLNDDGTVNYYLDATDSHNKDGVAPSITGTADSTTANKLTETGAFTEAEAFYVGKYIHNTTTDTYAMITAKDSDDALSLGANIMTNTNTYEICTAILDGSDGQVMVELPKFWYRSNKVGKTYEWYISDVARTGYKVHPAFIRDGVEKDKVYFSAFEGFFNSTTAKMESRGNCVPSTSNGTSDGGLSPVAAYGAIAGTDAGDIRNTRLHARARGAGWEQQDFLTRSALQLLYLIEYADFDSQTTIGAGVTGKAIGTNNNANKTGATLFLGNASGRQAGTDNLCSVSYRGVENMWGNTWEWVDGINLNNYVAYVADNGFQSGKFTSPYVDVGTVLSTTDTFIKDITFDGLDYGFLASEGGGSSSTYLHDNWRTASGSRVFRSGGRWSTSSPAGAFAWGSDTASSSGVRDIGARLSFLG